MLLRHFPLPCRTFHVPRSCHSADSPSVSSQAPNPFSVALSPNQPSPSLFASLPDVPPPAICCHVAPDLQLGHSSSHPESGPFRLTGFLGMPLDGYVNIVTAMVNDGRFSRICHGVLRLEGQIAGVYG